MEIAFKTCIIKVKTNNTNTKFKNKNSECDAQDQEDKEQDQHCVKFVLRRLDTEQVSRTSSLTKINYKTYWQTDGTEARVYLITEPCETVEQFTQRSVEPHQHIKPRWLTVRQ